jgi:regulator of protease activity HflC (stomatin/prohibitin superfamily)
MGFISSLITTLVAVLVFLNSNRITHKRTRTIVRAVTGLIAGVAAFSTIARSLVVIPAGSVGVVQFFGRVDQRPLNPGVHLLNPFSDVEQLSTRLKDVKETIETTSQEGLAFTMDVSLQYRLDPQKAAEVFSNIGTDEQEILTSQFRSIVREVTASYPAEAIYSTKRQEVTNRIQQRLTEQISPLGYTVQSALLREIVLPETLQAAIQEKLKAEQESRQMTFTLEQARQEAERKRVEARGIADAQAIVGRSLTRETLQLRAIEATQQLANSDNAKVLILNGGQGGAPVMFQLDSSTLQNPEP